MGQTADDGTRTSFGLVGAVSHVDRVRVGVALECLGYCRLHGQPPGLGEVEGLRVLLVAEVDEVGAGRSEPCGIQQKKWVQNGRKQLCRVGSIPAG